MTPTPLNERPSGEELQQHRRLARTSQKNLFVRNILNGIFMLIALVAMVGLLLSPEGSGTRMWFYGAGLLAVVVKMIEVVMRMPGFHNKNV